MSRRASSMWWNTDKHFHLVPVVVCFKPHFLFKISEVTALFCDRAACAKHELWIGDSCGATVNSDLPLKPWGVQVCSLLLCMLLNLAFKSSLPGSWKDSRGGDQQASAGAARGCTRRPGFCHHSWTASLHRSSQGAHALEARFPPLFVMGKPSQKRTTHNTFRV